MPFVHLESPIGEDYKAGSHSVWDRKYYLVWITKYRHLVLVGEVRERARELLREIIAEPGDDDLRRCD